MARDLTSTSDEQTNPRVHDAARTGTVHRPDTDIFETEDRIVLVADMPGVALDDVDITLERRVLSIRGRAGQPAFDGYRRVYAEYGEGDYERVFTLSEDIDRDQIKASLSDGVLTLELPKSETAQARKIEVKAS